MRREQKYKTYEIILRGSNNSIFNRHEIMTTKSNSPFQTSYKQMLPLNNLYVPPACLVPRVSFMFLTRSFEYVHTQHNI